VSRLAVLIAQTGPSYQDACQFLDRLDAIGFDYSKIEPKNILTAGSTALSASRISSSFISVKSLLETFS